MDPDKARYMAIGSLVTGILGLACWLCVCTGFPLSIAGIVLGALALKSDQRVTAMIGIGLNAVGLLASIANLVLGIYLGVSGQNPLLRELDRAAEARPPAAQEGGIEAAAPEDPTVPGDPAVPNNPAVPTNPAVPGEPGSAAQVDRSARE